MEGDWEVDLEVRGQGVGVEEMEAERDTVCVSVGRAGEAEGDLVTRGEAVGEALGRALRVTEGDTLEEGEREGLGD